jgi:hypothetical protein
LKSDERYQAPRDGEAWLLPRVITDPLDWIALLRDKEEMERIVKTRSALSAVGLDGIGYQVYKAGGPIAVEFLSQLFGKIALEQQVPQGWRYARTCLLFKAGDADIPANWRPITITDATYRILTAAMASYLQKLNGVKKQQIFSHTQKAFLAGVQGCTEHSVLLNELFADAIRHEKSIVVTQIDITNAFGAVSQKQIWAIMT